MKINKFFLFLLWLSFFKPVFAEDPSYFLPGGTPDSELEGQKGEDSGYFLPGYGSDEDLLEQDEKSILYFLPGTTKELDAEVAEEKENTKTFIVSPKPEETPEFSVGNLADENIGQLPAGSRALEKSEYEGMDNMDKLNKLREKAKNQLSFAALLDDYNYGGPAGVYDQLYEGSNKNFFNNFFFQGSYNYTFVKNFILLSAGLNAGVSYKTGKGEFEDGEVSNTTLALWAIPVDINLNLQIPLGSLFRIEASAGPSLMTLLQNRDDRSDGEPGQNLYQISPGYFTGGSFKINWGNIFKSSGLALFNSSDVTNFFLSFNARYESYNKFSEESVMVDGVSYGLGLSFEFL
jgi:hypothetical protein